MDVRKDLYGNAVLSGETTIFAGVGGRVTNELLALAPSAMTIEQKPPDNFRMLVPRDVLQCQDKDEDRFVLCGTATWSAEPQVVCKDICERRLATDEAGMCQVFDLSYTKWLLHRVGSSYLLRTFFSTSHALCVTIQ